MMMKVLEAQLLFCVMTLSAATEEQLVRCGLPVHVKFIVSPEQHEPAFKEPSKHGQKHWSAYRCEMNEAEARHLQATSSTDNSTDDDANETTTATTTTTSPTTTTSANTTNVTNANTTTTSPNTSGLLALNETVNAELGGAHCWKTWTSGLLSLGLSLSLPVAHAAPGAFMMPSQPRKLDDLPDVVEVLMPCSALLDPLKDLDGDGALDCKVTQEQSSIAVSVPEVEGNWRVLSAQAVSSSNPTSNRHLPRDSITIGGGAWCVEPAQTARLASKLELLAQEELPLALTNVARFTHDGQVCSMEKSCEASMWSFDLAYPSSSCTPEVVGWIQPCMAKLLPDGTLILLRGAPTLSGGDVHRPPLMAALSDVKDALSFVNGVAAATRASFEVLILKKHSTGLNAVLLAEQKLQSAGANDGNDNFAEVRQLQASSDPSNFSNSSDDDDETSTTSTTPTTTSSSPVNITTTANTTTNATANATTTVNGTEEVAAELGQARDLRLWSTAFFCCALRFLVC
jgi:cytoskeletal protein RodZ